MNNYILHLENKAFNWENASPVGCGSLGLMVYGRISEERLCYNEESIWAGEKTDTIVKGYDEKIAHIRKMFLDGNEYEAQKWAEENMSDCFRRVKSYEYAGELFIKLHDDDNHENYSRDIDLINGICTVKYDKDGKHFYRENFASYPDKLLCTKLTCDHHFSAAIRYSRELIDTVSVNSDSISVICHTAEGTNHFSFNAIIKTDGIKEVNDGSLCIKDASYIEIYVSIFSSFKYDNLESAANDVMRNVDKGWERIKQDHIKDFSELMKRSDISFEGDSELEKLPIPERLSRLQESEENYDNRLLSLYWQFGKYLLISSSRDGTLPANLQGVWCTGLTPDWNSDYHTNINLQMNYWHSEEANITECNSALFSYMNNYLMPDGKVVARENYNTKGLVVHHVSDIYGFAAVADGPWGMWPMGGAWLAFHMWEHYLYTEDKTWLKETAYEYIRNCADFIMDNLFEGNDGYLYSGPSTSPENSYVVDYKGEKVNVLMTISPTMDTEIISELLDFYAKTEEILMIDCANAKKASDMKARLLPLKVGKNKQLMEWYKDYDESEVGHRHISHGFGLYPGTIINHNTPDLMDAMKVTLDRRINGEGWHPGWSWAWLGNLAARTGDNQMTYSMIRNLLTLKTLPNLLDTHSPFQIDGNFGGSAAIGEMVMQSHEGYISIIPAIPNNINGYFEGLKARGNITVSARWKKGSVKELKLSSELPKEIMIKIPGKDIFKVNVDKAEKVITF